MKKLILILLMLPLIGWGQDTVDYYPISNYDSYVGSYIGGQVYRGMSFTCASAVMLDSVKVYLSKIGSPTGNSYALIYAHSGTYGTSSVPTGSELSTSNALDVSTLQTHPNYQLFNLTFSGVNKIILSASTYYELVIKSDVGDSPTNAVRIGSDNSSPTHSGNRVSSPDGTTWTPATTSDMIFYVFGHEVETTQKNIFMGTNF